jgi:hypothetical protein
MVEFEVAAHSGSDCLKVVLVGTDHEVASAEGSFNHARVDDVGSRGASGECADRAGLAASAAPGLRHHGRGNRGHLTKDQRGAVAGPHAAFAPVGSRPGR